MNKMNALLSAAATALLCSAVSAQAAYQVVPDGGRAVDITPDGRYVLGTGTNPATGQWEGFIWEWQASPTPSYVLGPCDVDAISDDGTVVAGNFGATFGGPAGRWTQAGGWVPIGELGAPCGSSIANVYDMSGDGDVIVGLGWISCAAYPFRWTEATGMVAGEDVGTWHLPTSRASAVSRNGLRHAGFVQTNNRAPAYWEADVKLEISRQAAQPSGHASAQG